MKTISKMKYVVLFVIFTLSVIINVTYVKNERNIYEKNINTIRNEVEQLRKAPGNEAIIIEKENKVTELNSESFWINIQYFFFMVILGTVAAIVFGNFGLWGYTKIDFIKKKIEGADNEVGKLDKQDTENYSMVIAAVFLGICIVIAEALRVAFGQ